MKFKANRLALLALLAAATACGDGLVQMTGERQTSMAGETITVIKGNAQVGVAGVALPKPIVFIVRNSGGTPLGGAAGTIAVTAGGGLTSRTTFKTNSTGKISFLWTLGATGPQTVTIALTGGAVSAQATATVIPIGSDLAILSGNNQSAAVGDTLANPVRVELRDPSNNPIAGATITYEILDGSGGGVRTLRAKTSDVGRVSNFWAMGWNKKPQKLVAKIAGVDSVTFDATATTTGITFAINAGNNQVGSPNTALPELISVELKKNGVALSKGKGRFEVRNGAGSLSKTDFVTNSNGRATATWTLGPTGTQKVKAIIGAVDSLTFTATFTASCTPTSIAAGATVQLTSSTFCLSGGASGAEFTVIGVNTASTSSLFSLTASNITAVTGTPNPNVIPGSRTLTMPKIDRKDSFEWDLRKREKQLLDATAPQYNLARQNVLRPNFNIVPGTPTVGSTMTLNVQAMSTCGSVVSRTATVKAVTDHVILMEDNSNPTGGFSTTDYNNIAAEFELLVWDVDVNNFGSPSDIDTNSRVIALFTDAVNDLTPDGTADTEGFVGGFFFGRDLLATAGCAGSNQGEMFYMLAPDPTGENGNVFTTEQVRTLTVGTLAHEFQHLINTSRRSAAGYPAETVAMNEGLSHIAEELVYYAATGHAPGQNINGSTILASQGQLDAYLLYSEQNVLRFFSWLVNSNLSGPFTSNDALATRGAIWNFLRYAADRKGGTQAAFWNALTSSPQTGMANVAARIGTSVEPWVRDWAGAVYTDDVLGNNPNPSWNLRSVFALYSIPFPLTFNDPVANVGLGVNLAGNGSSIYMRFRVEAGQTSNVTINSLTASQTGQLFRRN